MVVHESTGQCPKGLYLLLRLDAKHLHGLPLDKVPKRHRAVHVEQRDIFTAKVFKLLEKQNVELTTKGKIVLKELSVIKSERISSSSTRRDRHELRKGANFYCHPIIADSPGQ